MATTFLLRKFCWRENRETAHKVRYSFPGPRGGWKTATRALVKEFVLLYRAKLLDTPAATFGIFSGLEVTHVNFLFLLFAHITFLSCVYGFGFCLRRIVAVPYDLLVWDQVVQTDQLIFRTLL